MLDLQKIRNTFDSKLDEYDSSDFLTWLMEHRYGMAFDKGSFEAISSLQGKLVDENRDLIVDDKGVSSLKITISCTYRIAS